MTNDEAAKLVCPARGTWRRHTGMPGGSLGIPAPKTNEPRVCIGDRCAWWVLLASGIGGQCAVLYIAEHMEG